MNKRRNISVPRNSNNLFEAREMKQNSIFGSSHMENQEIQVKTYYKVQQASNSDLPEAPIVLVDNGKFENREFQIKKIPDKNISFNVRKNRINTFNVTKRQDIDNQFQDSVSFFQINGINNGNTNMPLQNRLNNEFEPNKNNNNNQENNWKHRTEGNEQVDEKDFGDQIYSKQAKMSNKQVLSPLEKEKIGEKSSEYVHYFTPTNKKQKKENFFQTPPVKVTSQNSRAYKKKKNSTGNNSSSQIDIKEGFSQLQKTRFETGQQQLPISQQQQQQLPLNSIGNQKTFNQLLNEKMNLTSSIFDASNGPVKRQNYLFPNSQDQFHLNSNHLMGNSGKDLDFLEFQAAGRNTFHNSIPALNENKAAKNSIFNNKILSNYKKQVVDDNFVLKRENHTSNMHDSSDIYNKSGVRTLRQSIGDREQQLLGPNLNNSGNSRIIQATPLKEVKLSQKYLNKTNSEQSDPITKQRESSSNLPSIKQQIQQQQLFLSNPLNNKTLANQKNNKYYQSNQSNNNTNNTLNVTSNTNNNGNTSNIGSLSGNQTLHKKNLSADLSGQQQSRVEEFLPYSQNFSSNNNNFFSESTKDLENQDNDVNHHLKDEIGTIVSNDTPKSNLKIPTLNTLIINGANGAGTQDNENQTKENSQNQTQKINSYGNAVIVSAGAGAGDENIGSQYLPDIKEETKLQSQEMTNRGYLNSDSKRAFLKTRKEASSDPDLSGESNSVEFGALAKRDMRTQKSLYKSTMSEDENLGKEKRKDQLKKIPNLKEREIFDQHQQKALKEIFQKQKFNIDYFIQTQKIYRDIMTYLKRNFESSPDLIDKCSEFCRLGLMSGESQSTWIQNLLLKEEQYRKIIRHHFFQQRIAFLVVVFCSLEQKNFSSNMNNLKNIFHYLHKNLFLIMDFINTKIKKLSQSYQQPSSSSTNASSQGGDITFSQEEIALLNKLNVRTLFKLPLGWMNAQQHQSTASNISKKSNFSLPSQTNSNNSGMGGSNNMNIPYLSQSHILDGGSGSHNTADIFQNLRQNNQMILNLIKSSIKSDRDISHLFVNFIQNQQDTLEQALHLILTDLAFYLTQMENQTGRCLDCYFFSVAPEPYIKAKSTFQFMLVLDLDETLVHYSQTSPGHGQFAVRPYTHTFLAEMAKYYQIAIFTAGMPDYANWVLDILDKNQVIAHRFYRYHTTRSPTVFVKDLSRIGRDLSKTIIVDNIAENFQLQPENGIFIKSWFKDASDTALYELIPLLREIATQNVDDVRVGLKQLKDQMLSNISKGDAYPHLNVKLN